MRILALCAGVAAVLALTTEAAHACSCAGGDPRAALARADAAFVGVLLERRDETTFVFRVEERVKGPLAVTVEVRSASNGAACGLEVQVGRRIGLFLDRDRGTWHGNLCGQIAPERLREAARPLPAPDGSGPVALLVGGTFGPARTLALDRRGRTLAYGRGSGETVLLAACPGGRRSVELVYGDRVVLAVRHLPRLRIERRRVLPLNWREGGAEGIWCRDAAAKEIVVFAPNRQAQTARILRVRGIRTATIWRGAAVAMGVRGPFAYLSAGTRGDRLVIVDLANGRARRVARLPADTGPLAPSADGESLAGVAYSALSTPTSPPSRLVVVDVRAWRVRTTALAGSNVTGDVFWLRGGRLAFFPRGGADAVRVYDASLRVRSRFREWNVRATALVGSTAYGLAYDGRLLSAPLPEGPARLVRRLPGPVTTAVATVPR